VGLISLEWAEKLLHWPKSWRLAPQLKSLISRYFLAVCGLSCTCVSYEKIWNLNQPSLIMFNHVSNMDAFAIPLTMPHQLKCVAKTDLFKVPFLGWLAIAFGAIPINRKSRNQAIQALEACGRNVVKWGDFMAISPEGTRSKTGLLAKFKKGPFYLQESLQIPAIPCIIYGSYEVWPSGAFFNAMGQIHVRYLDPIYPQEGQSREDAMRVVREKMLDALTEIPEGAGKPLTFRQMVDHFAAMFSMWAFVYIESILVQRWLMMHNISFTKALAGVTLGSIPVSFVIYILYVKFLYAQGSLAASKQEK